MLESMETGAPTASAPRVVRRSSVYTKKLFKKWMTPNPGHRRATTALGLIALFLGLYGCLIGWSRLGQGTSMPKGKELFFVAAGMYVVLKLLLAGTGLFMLLRHPLALKTSIATLVLAVPATALYATFVSHRPTNSAVLILVLLTPLYVALVFYLVSPRVLREFQRRKPEPMP
jgi:hypothetical protein